MPLKFQTHRPPELLEELRNLYRKVDKATSVIQTVQTTIEAATEDEVDETQSVLAWDYASLLGGTVPADGTVVLSRTLATIKGRSYTHLEVDVAVLEAGGDDVTMDWVIRGDTSFYIWDGVLKEWVLVGASPAFYSLTVANGNQVPYTIGRYRILPKYAAVPQDGDLAYTPVVPSGDPGGATEHKLTLVGTIRVGGSPSSAWCYKAWWVGRYVTWPTPGAPPQPCPTA